MPARRPGKKPEKQTRIAKERIRVLFEKAEEEFSRKPQLSHRWVRMAMKIATRYNIRLPKEFRRRTCRKCLSFLVPGKNCRVRTNPRQRALVIKCLECGSISRFPYRREKKKGV
jgi:ribonuclease P protein subunit RPR2